VLRQYPGSPIDGIPPVILYTVEADIVKSIGQPLPERVMEAFGNICRQATGCRFAGFASTMQIRSCHPNETETLRVGMWKTVHSGTLW